MPPPEIPPDLTPVDKPLEVLTALTPLLAPPLLVGLLYAACAEPTADAAEVER